MEKAVAWWCNLIGINDPAAIQIATGISAVLLALALLLVVFGVLAHIAHLRELGKSKL